MGASESTARNERNSNSTEEENASSGSQSTAYKILTGAAIGAVALGAYALSSSSSSTSETPNNNAQPFSSSSPSSSSPFPDNRQKPKNPEKNWIRCNVDGSVQHQNGSAGCGGVFRDASGVWRHGFSYKLPQCDIMEAELFGIITGLSIAWEKGFHNVTVESDNSQAVDMAIFGCKEKDKYYPLIKQVNGLKGLPWDYLNIVSVNRKENKVADWMAYHSHKLKEGLHEFPSPPDEIPQNLLEDGSAGIIHSPSVDWMADYSARVHYSS